MPTYIKTGLWEKVKTGYKGWLNLDDLITSLAGSSVWGAITGTLSAQTDLQAALDLKEDKINVAVALVDSATIDIASEKNTLSSSSATRTFTISYTGDVTETEVTLANTAATYTFPATSLVINSAGVASGDNTGTLAGVSGDKYLIMTSKIGAAYYVVIKNFGQ